MADVESDEVGEPEWPHGEVASEFHDVVDIAGGCDIVVPCVEGLVDEWHEDAVGDESGAVVCGDGCFSHLYCEVEGSLGGFVAGGEAFDDFDEFHDGDGVEEVHSDDAMGVVADYGCDVGD